MHAPQIQPTHVPQIQPTHVPQIQPTHVSQIQPTQPTYVTQLQPPPLQVPQMHIHQLQAPQMQSTYPVQYQTPMNYESMDPEIPVKHDYPFPVPEESLLPQLHPIYLPLEIAGEYQQRIDKDSEYDLVNTTEYICIYIRCITFVLNNILNIYTLFILNRITIKIKMIEY